MIGTNCGYLKALRRLLAVLWVSGCRHRFLDGVRVPGSGFLRFRACLSVLVISDRGERFLPDWLSSLLVPGVGARILELPDWFSSLPEGVKGLEIGNCRILQLDPLTIAHTRS